MQTEFFMDYSKKKKVNFLPNQPAHFTDERTEAATEDQTQIWLSLLVLHKPSHTWSQGSGWNSALKH